VLTSRFLWNPNLNPSPTVLSRFIVSNNVQNLRRVRVRSLPWSPTMIKSHLALAHSPIFCSCCPPCLCDPDEPCHAFFSPVFWPGSYALALDRTRYRYAVRCWLSNGLVAARTPYKTTDSPGLLRCCLGSSEIYHGLSCSLSMYNSLNDNQTAPFSFLPTCPT